MLSRYGTWSGALTVLVITAALVVLDLSDGSVHRYLLRHSFTSSVLSGVLVLLLTLLIVDRVIRMRQLKNQSRAIAAQAALIVAQANRTADAITRPDRSADDDDEALAELRTYTQMLLTSAPLLIDAKLPRAFLETAQRVAAQLFRALHPGDGKAGDGKAGDGEAGDREAERTKTRVDHAVQQLRDAAAPLLQVLSGEQRAAVSSDDAG